MDVLLFGGSGLLGQSLKTVFVRDFGWTVSAPSSRQVNVTDPHELERRIRHHAEMHPHPVVVNCTGLTDVDVCEQQQLHALRMNAYVPAIMSMHCQMVDCPFVHVSTDQVFGESVPQPYLRHTTDDPFSDDSTPVNTYGQTKLWGEKHVRLYPKSTIVRVQWLYGPGKRTWIDKVARWLLQGQPVKAVMDYHGVPTACEDVAISLGHYLATGQLQRVLHLVNSGDAISRYDLARFVAHRVGAKDTLIEGVSRSDLLPKQWKARRPCRSLLVPSPEHALPDWHTSLERYLAQTLVPSLTSRA